MTRPSNQQGDVKVRNQTHTDIKTKYTFREKLLGNGNHGTVYEGVLISSPHTEVAIRAIEKSKTKDNLDNVDSYVTILKKLDHPNIVKYYETLENNKYYFIVMELCKGGDLFDIIKQKSDSQKNFTEAQAGAIVFDILKALNYCHNKGIAHLDIRPENILIGDKGELKLIDFKTSMSDNVQELSEASNRCS